MRGGDGTAVTDRWLRSLEPRSSSRPMYAASPIANTATTAAAHRNIRVSRSHATLDRRGEPSFVGVSYIASGTRRVVVFGDDGVGGDCGGGTRVS